MGTINLSKRLKAAADFVKIGESILDIGSDHAYLPIYLAQQGLISKAIAGEVARGPYEKAVKQVEMYQLEGKIKVRFGNGFDVLGADEEVGTIFICGMGGLLISEIISNGLENNKIQKSARLVLQANNAEVDLRTFLMDNQYEIVQETILEENNKIYEIIVAEFAEETMPYTDEELLFGPILLENQPGIFIKKWQREFDNNIQILKQLENTNHNEKKEALTKKNKQIKKVIS